LSASACRRASAAEQNVWRTIVDASVERASELLADRDQREIARCTPHTLRRTFASILAEISPAGGLATN
jgi:hypothetical protein